MLEHERRSDDRLEALEVKAAFQEALLDQLSGSLYAQDRRVDSLERTVKDLVSRLKDLAGESLSDLKPNERPPHY